MVAVFLLRIDSVTGKGEGEVYVAISKGIMYCNFWNSPKLTDHDVIIANGIKEIKKIYDKYPNYDITEVYWEPIKEIK